MCQVFFAPHTISVTISEQITYVFWQTQLNLFTFNHLKNKTKKACVVKCDQSITRAPTFAYWMNQCFKKVWKPCFIWTSPCCTKTHYNQYHCSHKQPFHLNAFRPACKMHNMGSFVQQHSCIALKWFKGSRNKSWSVFGKTWRDAFENTWKE